MKTFFVALSILLTFGIATQASAIDARFDHELHLRKVFGPEAVQCNHCHSFSLEGQEKKVNLGPEFRETALRIPMKQICHECHQAPESQHINAPKDCYTCHRSFQSLDKIKPLNHRNVSWKDSHSTIARVQGDKCFACHTQSTCTKCHLERNDIQMSNHSRNFRFYHSIQARLQPQKCGICHTTNYCMSCHQGKPVH